MDLTVKNVYSILKIKKDLYMTEERKYLMILDILDLPKDIPLNKVLDYIFESRFVSPKNENGNKTFDFIRDYDIIWALLKEKGTDLNKEMISWWEFSSMLEVLFLSDNALTKRIGYRSYKTPIKVNKDNREFVKSMNNQKLKYSLEQPNNEFKMKSFFNSLKSIAKRK